MSENYEYGGLDHLQALAWYGILYLCVNQFGWIFGFLSFVISLNVIAVLLKATMNLEMMSGNDEMFFLDDDRNRMNIVAFHRVARFDAQVMAKTMVTRACLFPRLKSKVRKFLGRYMFEEMSDEQMVASIPRSCITVSDIHSEQ